MPTTRKNLIPYFLKGKGDIAMGSLTVTKGRRAEVDFSDPFISELKELGKIITL